MHIPKSAGMSFHAALESALEPGSLTPRRMDTSTFCGFRDFDLLQPSVRDRIATNDEEVEAMREFRAISGHFSLDILLRLTTASAVGTILREPRARLMSLYMYWRVPKIFDELLPYSVEEYSLKPFDLFLSEPRLAPAVDNQVCRLLLLGDPRIPNDGFISDSYVEAVATDAIARLDTLGFVGVLELGDSAWEGLAQFFGVDLEPHKINVTGESGDPVAALPGEELFTAKTLDLLERRNAVDRVIYEHGLGLAGVCPEDRGQLAETAFRRQLTRLNGLVGRTGVHGQPETQAQLESCDRGVSSPGQRWRIPLGRRFRRQ
jgi:hypothetical protein